MKKIFVFASNLAGQHHGGSAKHAWQHFGAEWGVGIGPQGDSYAIPTLDEFFGRMSVRRIKVHVDNFLEFAARNLDKEFHIVAIGCGIAGFLPGEIAPLFKHAPTNCTLPPEFRYINEELP